MHRKIERIPKALDENIHWQYGTGYNSSATTTILGSMVYTEKSDGGLPVEIMDLVLKRSSQWVLGSNVKRKEKLEHINRISITFVVDDQHDCI